MARGTAKSPALAGTRWVHVFEEDTARGAVYRREDDDIPLSRRPRERLELRRDGSAVVFTSGPDDRFVAQHGTWREEGDGVVVRTPQHELRIVRVADRLVVRTSE